MKTPSHSSSIVGIHPWIIFCLVGAIAVVCTPHVSHAQTAIVQNLVYSGTSAGLSTGSTYGFTLTVGANPILITALGQWDRYDDGLLGPSQVGLWTAEGTSLASVTLQSGNGSTLIYHFRYENISPVTLNANAIYLLGVYNTSGDAFYTETSYTITSVVTGLTSRASAFGFSAPINPGGTIALGANAIYSAVPEPSTYAVIFGVLALGFAAYRRRQKRSA
jgi:hypothetical protein